MQLKNKLIAVTTLVICIDIIGAGTANAASPSSSRISGLLGQVSAAPQSMAVESGGSNSSSSPGVSDILSGVGSVLRSAGGAGVIGKTLQCIYNTARMCPECFFL